ncbi:Protein phosphatase PHLPP-like protein [Folsomia candida]|uniref:Protein phosphatase PHLPP-like protein n=1 Tax=Folsomia candida TaxID=158441 RepID=A0A226F352_FOLCA|nr:Protein phosphatase PHLPP-like protein [Folsomia candida]
MCNMSCPIFVYLFQRCTCQTKKLQKALTIFIILLTGNKIEFVSKDFIQRATRLKILNLSRNMIEHMPNFGKKCPVNELYMSRNKLQDTHEKDCLEFLSECGQLKRLHLGYNKIEHINDRCISVWRNLEELILCGNRIRTLPAKISSLTSLRVLRVHSNSLETAPNLTKMQSLKMVDLSHNVLRKINLETLISGGNLTYLDISCNERLSLNAEKLSTQNQKRPMNLVEVTHPRKRQSIRQNETRDFPANPPWEIGFSELPDRNLVLSVSQYRDINISNGQEALFGLFDGGDGNSAPKYISKSIAKIYAEEKNIEETHGFSLKYTLLNAIKSIKQQGYSRPLQGILCLLSRHEDPLYPGKLSFYLNLAMVGGIRCLLVESGKKLTRLTDITEMGLENQQQIKNSDGSEPSSYDNNSETSSTQSARSNSNENNLNENIPDPKVLSIPLSTNAEFLIIGNHSVWNYVNEPELIEELETHRHKKSVLIAKRLADMAQSHTCKQSISLIVVKFKWHVSTSSVIRAVEGHGIGNHKANKFSPSSGGDLGPLSYYSGSSEEYSEPNPLISVITPDSAIDTDRSSGAGSVGSNGGSTKSASTNASDHKITRPRFSQDSKERNHEVSSSKSTHSDRTLKSSLDREDDQASLANTSVSHMSVEQFCVWEYMLEQNAKMLFKKELDTLSKAKGVFARNQKLRKSVHFPYQQPGNAVTAPAPSDSVQQHGHKSSQNLHPNSNNRTPGFYTLSKAKSLSHLFGAEPTNTNKIVVQSEPPFPPPKPTKPSRFPIFGNGNTSAGFLGSVRSSARRAILGGPNAAYFSSSQRQANIPPIQDSQEIQEVRNFDSIEHEGRLKRYWENKITEL